MILNYSVIYNIFLVHTEDSLAYNYHWNTKEVDKLWQIKGIQEDGVWRQFGQGKAEKSYVLE